MIPVIHNPHYVDYMQHLRLSFRIYILVTRMNLN